MSEIINSNCKHFKFWVMKSIKNNFCFAVAFSFLIVSCTKEGPAGPAGQQGSVGATGAQGPKGDKGDKGDPGNANVMEFIKDISTAVWTTVGTSSAGYLKLDISAPNTLTTDVVNNWVNLVYVYSSDGAGPWVQLPYYTERNIRVRAEISVGLLTLKRDQDGKPFTQSWFNKVRLICIKPTSTGTISRQSAPLPDFSDYHAVCRYYGLSE